ncbi:MAG: hypothetical protein M3R17_14620 [Bacteroidota bacterium]|nr:hypothetical protein [Bacteroidota bacterium]
MKKLAVTSIAVFIALCGFIAILCFLPCNENCCGGNDECNKQETKCSGEKKDCDHDAKCSGDNESCHEGKGEHRGGHDGCGGGNENCSVREWKDGDGKCPKEVKVIINGDGKGDAHGSCPMEMGDHSGCCGCCMMKHGGGMNCSGMDSMGEDSVRIKVRGKL